MGIRLVVVDDNPHVSWEGRVHPVNATFHRFLSALLDLPRVAPVASIVHVRAAAGTRTQPPGTLAARPADPGRRDRAVRRDRRATCATCRRCSARIGRSCGRAIAEADLVWIKVPASNAALAAAIAARAGVASVRVRGRAARRTSRPDRPGAGSRAGRAARRVGLRRGRAGSPRSAATGSSSVATSMARGS